MQGLHCCSSVLWQKHSRGWEEHLILVNMPPPRQIVTPEIRNYSTLCHWKLKVMIMMMTNVTAAPGNTSQFYPMLSIFIHLKQLKSIFIQFNHFVHSIRKPLVSPLMKRCFAWFIPSHLSTPVEAKLSEKLNVFHNLGTDDSRAGDSAASKKWLLQMKMTSEQKIALVQSINQTDDLMWSEISEWVHPYFILIWETFDHWHWMHSNPGIAIAYQDGCQLVELKTQYQIVFFEKLSFLFCCSICLRWKRSATAKLLRKSAPPNKVISPCRAQLWDVLASQNAHNKISVLYIWPDITNWDQIQHQIQHLD